MFNCCGNLGFACTVGSPLIEAAASAVALIVEKNKRFTWLGSPPECRTGGKLPKTVTGLVAVNHYRAGWSGFNLATAIRGDDT